METRVNYTLVGLFVVLLTLGIVASALWLTDSLQEKPYKDYQILMNESVAGLSVQAPVKYNGVDVGYVSHLKINLNNPQQVILMVKIEPYVPITQDTRAILMAQGITGIAYIGLQGGKPGSKPLVAKAGEPYPVIQSIPSFLVRLDQSLQNLTSNINSLTINIKQMLSQSNLDALHQSLENINAVTSSLAQNRSKIDSTINSLNTTLKNTASASQKLPELVNHLSQMSQNVSNSSLGINKDVQLFSTQIMPQTYDTLNNLKNLTANLQSISSEIQNNPSMLIRGKSPAKPGPGEQ